MAFKEEKIYVTNGQNKANVRRETSAVSGVRVTIVHHKVDEQPHKKPKKSYHSHKGSESEDKSPVAIVKTVPQMGCVSQDSEALESQRGAEQSLGETRCNKFWDQFDEYDS